MSKYYSIKELLFSAKGQLSSKTMLLLTLIFCFLSQTLEIIPTGLILGHILVIILGFFSIIFLIKRLHSFGISGWSLLLFPFSLIGVFIVPSILIYSRGKEKSNDFGKVDKKKFKNNFLEKTSAFLETTKGRFGLIGFFAIFYVVSLYQMETEIGVSGAVVDIFEVVLFLILLIHLIHCFFALRLKRVEKHTEDIIQFFNYLGIVVLSSCLLYVVFMVLMQKVF
ncbi:MAG: DUF805 domain-containing protein [Alphaproteobacteria bacterium]